MKLQEQIQHDSMQALKDGRKADRSVLSTLYSAVKNKAVDFYVLVLEDNETLSIIQKFIKSLEDEIEAFKKANRTEKVEELTHQMEVVKAYLPTLLTEDEVKAIISALPDKSIKSVMMEFKSKYQGKVDMGLVSKIAKQFN